MTASDRRNAVKEADLLAILNHPNIVAYFGSYLCGGQLLIEMEFCEGGTLCLFLTRLENPLPEKEILGLFRQVISALSYLDDMNILHRDLKTENIFLTKNASVVKLGDFGIAKVLSAQKPSASTVLGTPFIFSPEVCEGKRYSKKSDIWAAGCILYEITCLQRTFDGPSLPLLINRIVKGSFAPVKGSYSPGLRQLISDLLQKNPDLRPRASEVLISIDQLLIECSVNQRQRRQKKEAEVTETGFSCDVLSFIDKSKPRRSLIYQVKFTPVVHLVSPVLFPSHHVVQMQRVRNETLLLTSEGTVLVGCNNRPIKIASDLFGKKITKVSIGAGFMFFLTDNGLLLASGDPKTNCLGRYLDSSGRSMEYVHSPQVIDCLLGVDVIDVASCIDHTIVCSREGDAYSWGYNRSGCLGVGDECASPVLIPTPVMIPSSVKVTSVFTGKNSSVILDDKSHVWVFGSNSSRKLGLDSPDDVYFPQKLSWVTEPVSKVTLGDNSTCLLLADGSVLILGRSFQETSFTRKILPKTFLPKINLSSRVTSVCCGSQFFLALTQDSEIYFWGQRRKNVRQSESFAFHRTKSVVTEHLGKEDIIVGDADESLMEIVSRVGPDCPVLLVKEPQVRLNDFQQIQRFRSDEEIIQEPNLVLALYSSQIHLRAGETITFADILCFGDDEVYLIIETNCQKDSFSKLKTAGSLVSESVTLRQSLCPDKLSPTTRIPSWVIKEYGQPDLRSTAIMALGMNVSRDVLTQESIALKSIPNEPLNQMLNLSRNQVREELSSLRKQNMRLQAEISHMRRNESMRRSKQSKWTFLFCCYRKR